MCGPSGSGYPSYWGSQPSSKRGPTRTQKRGGAPWRGLAFAILLAQLPELAQLTQADRSRALLPTTERLLLLRRSFIRARGHLSGEVAHGSRDTCGPRGTKLTD